MTALYISCVFVLLVHGLTAAVPHPIQAAGNHTKCEFAQLPTGYLQIGKTVSVPGECMQITCQEDLTITGITCPTYFSTPGCYATEINHYKEYPECCPVVECNFGIYSTTNIHKRHTLTSSSHQCLPHKLAMVYSMLIVFSISRTIII